MLKPFLSLATKWHGKESRRCQTKYQPYRSSHDLRVLRRFLGMINFYRQFITRAAEYQSTLHATLSELRGAQTLERTPTKTYVNCKAALLEATLLAYRALDAPLGLFTDVSKAAAGAISNNVTAVHGNCLLTAIFSHFHAFTTFPPRLGSKACRYFQVGLPQLCIAFHQNKVK